MMAEAILTTARRAIPLRSKVFAYRLVDRLRLWFARLVRFLPGSWRIFGIPRTTVRSLRDWVETSRLSQDWMMRCKGATYEVCSPPELVIRQAPLQFQFDTAHHAFTLERYHLHHEVFLARIPGGRVLGPGGVVITPDGGALEESTWGDGWLARDRAFASYSLPKPEKLDGNFYTIASLFSEGYWHWLLEAMPRLFALEKLPIDDMQIIVSNNLHSWQQQSLSLLGFENLGIVPLENRHLELEFLYFPSYVGTTGNPHRLGCNWLRERFLRGFELRRPTRRLYITRRAAMRRRVVNEPDLEAILEKFEFEIVEAENISFESQVRLFSEAEAIAGPHGAGLTNMLFSPAGCKVLEFFDPNHMKVNFYSEADVLGHKYWHIIGDTTGTSAAHSATGHDDILVSAEILERTLENMFLEV